MGHFNFCLAILSPSVTHSIATVVEDSYARLALHSNNRGEARTGIQIHRARIKLCRHAFTLIMAAVPMARTPYISVVIVCGN